MVCDILKTYYFCMRFRALACVIAMRGHSLFCNGCWWFIHNLLAASGHNIIQGACARIIAKNKTGFWHFLIEQPASKIHGRCYFTRRDHLVEPEFPAAISAWKFAWFSEMLKTLMFAYLWTHWNAKFGHAIGAETPGNYCIRQPVARGKASNMPPNWLPLGELVWLRMQHAKSPSPLHPLLADMVSAMGR